MMRTTLTRATALLRTEFSSLLLSMVSSPSLIEPKVCAFPERASPAQQATSSPKSARPSETETLARMASSRVSLIGLVTAGWLA
jgi:hypothetical protein